MDERALMAPLMFRFTEPEDIKRYGEGPYVYDESLLVRLPARELIELETELGTTLVSVMNGFRADSVLGNLAGTWLALRMADPERAGSFDDFSPMIMLITFERWIADEVQRPGKDEGTHPSPESAPPPASGSAQAPTVALVTMPATE